MSIIFYWHEIAAISEKSKQWIGEYEPIYTLLIFSFSNFFINLFFLFFSS